MTYILLAFAIITEVFGSTMLKLSASYYCPNYNGRTFFV